MKNLNRKYIENQKFNDINFAEERLEKGDYEDCSFENCSFAKSDLSNINFMNCEIKNCDLSLAKISNTVLQDVRIRGCKLFGLQFNDCNQFVFSVAFDGCKLNMSSFYTMDLRNIKFKDCILQEVDFTNANLTGMIFENCDLVGAIFDNTILEKADFRTSNNYSINLEINRIKKAKFSISGILGLLDKYDIVIE